MSFSSHSQAFLLSITIFVNPADPCWFVGGPSFICSNMEFSELYLKKHQALRHTYFSVEENLSSEILLPPDRLVSQDYRSWSDALMLSVIFMPLLLVLKFLLL